MISNSFSSSAFDELCKYVCSQLSPSGSEKTDREALYFAVYWQLCTIFDKQVIYPKFLETKIDTFEYCLFKLVNASSEECSSLLRILENNIEEKLKDQYPYDFNGLIHITDGLSVVSTE